MPTWPRRRTTRFASSRSRPRAARSSTAWADPGPEPHRLELQLKTTELPRDRERRARLFDRVGELAGMSPKQVRRQIEVQTKEPPASPVTLKRDVAFDTVYFIRENQRHFPGVSVERVYVRRYPNGSLAAHLLGYVREISPKSSRTRAMRASSRATSSASRRRVHLDSSARGQRGTKVQVDAAGSRPAVASTCASREPATTSSSRSTPTFRRPARARSGGSGCRAGSWR